MQVKITIAAIAYYYLTNRFTGAIVFERDLMIKGGAGGAVGLQHRHGAAHGLHTGSNCAIEKQGRLA